jgi:prepilin-type processing-associated H-X9-DG protein
MAVICLSNLKQWGVLYTMYVTDYAQSLPTGWNGGTMWMVDLMAYYDGVDDIRLCPSATKLLHTIPGNVPGTFTAWGEYGHPDYFNGWVPRWGIKGQYGSYGVNGWAHNPLDKGVPGTYDTPPSERNLYWRKILIKGDASRIPLMGGNMWDGSGPLETDVAPAEKGIQIQSSDMTTFCLDRHEGGSNMLFMDSSSRKVGLKELWRLPWHVNWDYKKAERPDWPDWMNQYPDF